MLVIIAVPDLGFTPGETVDLPDDEAHGLVRDGLARPADSAESTRAPRRRKGASTTDAPDGANTEEEPDHG